MKKIFTLILVALATVATMGAADKLAYNITFAGNGTVDTAGQKSGNLDGPAIFVKGSTVLHWSDATLFSAGLEKIDTAASSIVKVYNYSGTYGVKFNTAKANNGVLTLALKPEAQVNATKIVLTASAYYTDFNADKRTAFSVNGIQTDTVNSVENADYEVALDSAALTSIVIKTSPLVNTIGRLNLKNIAVYVEDTNTAVADVTAAKQVATVRYYNLAGQQSAVPFEGINVVRTTYTDGTASVAKVLK